MNEPMDRQTALGLILCVLIDIGVWAGVLWLVGVFN